MRLDNTGHPVGQNATRVLFACFIGFCILGVADAVRAGGARPAWVWISAGVLGFLLGCSLVTYFRPRGAAAYVTSTAYVGLFVIFGASYAAVKFEQLTGSASAMVIVAFALIWLLIGFIDARKAHRAARELD